MLLLCSPSTQLLLNVGRLLPKTRLNWPPLARLSMTQNPLSLFLAPERPVSCHIVMMTEHDWLAFVAISNASSLTSYEDVKEKLGPAAGVGTEDDGILLLHQLVVLRAITVPDPSFLKDHYYPHVPPRTGKEATKFSPHIIKIFTMLKSTLIALLAFAATVSAQNTGMPDHIAFTQPVGDGNSYEPGSTKIFSWHGACVSPGTLTSITPTQAKVELVDSTDSNNAVFRKDVTTIDCTKPTGNVQWVVPTDQNPDAMYSLQIVLTPRNAYSGKFTIKSASSKPAPTQGGSGGEDKTPSSASSLAPAALTAAAAAAGALLLF